MKKKKKKTNGKKKKKKGKKTKKGYQTAAGGEDALRPPDTRPPTIRIARIAMRATTPHPNGDLVRNLLFSTDVLMWFFVTIRAAVSALFIDIGFPIIGKAIRLKPHMIMLTLGKLHHVAFTLDDAKKARTADAHS